MKTDKGRPDVLVYKGSNEHDLSGFEVYVGVNKTLCKEFTKKYYCDISIPVPYEKLKSLTEKYLAEYQYVLFIYS
jgi:hypothetical protein